MFQGTPFFLFTSALAVHSTAVCWYQESQYKSIWISYANPIQKLIMPAAKKAKGIRHPFFSFSIGHVVKLNFSI